MDTEAGVNIDTVLSGTHHTQKERYSVVPLSWSILPRKIKVHRENWVTFARTEGWKNWQLLSNGFRVLILEEKKEIRMNNRDHCAITCKCVMLQNYMSSHWLIWLYHKVHD